MKKHFLTTSLSLGWAVIMLFTFEISANTNRPGEIRSSLVLQDVKASLFKDATNSMNAARTVKADILAPKNFNKAMQSYQEADRDFKKGKNLEDIRKKLREASAYFKRAMEATKLAEVTFTTSMKARADALAVNAPKFANALWTEAEEQFAEAATKLEDGDVKGAKKKSGEAESIFRQAELDAIKANYLAETWQLLEQAEKMKVKDNAPKTLARAQKLIQQAEKELNTNRYDTDVARNLASEAKYEAKHAIYLSETIEKIKKSAQSEEDMLLGAETPLKKIATTLDLVPRFDSGLGQVTEHVMDYIKIMQDSISNLSQQLTDREQLLSDQSERIAELEKKLGGIAQEKTALAKRMEAQAKVREQFARVGKMFSQEEARVFREQDDVIIRLIGLNFASGQAVLEPEYFSLLTKVQEAINTFPGCSLTIEGHTDSFGGDEANLELSNKRAEAVRQYLLANMRMQEDRIKAIGYGESQPIANNETPEGRAKNRRIDIVIHPQIGGTN